MSEENVIRLNLTLFAMDLMMGIMAISLSVLTIHG